MAKNISSTKLLPILEQDEEDLIHSETSSSSSVHSLGSTGEEKSSYSFSSKNSGEKGRLTFVRRMPVIRDYTIDKHGYDYFSNLHRSSNNNNSSSSNTVNKTIYQIEKEKFHTDRNCPNFFYTSNRLKFSSSSSPSSLPLLSSQNFSSSSSSSSSPAHQCESRAVYLPYDTIYDKPTNLMKIPINDISENFATATPYKYLGSEKATVLKIFIAAPKRFIPRDTQEQIIIASPKQQQQRTEGSSQDSGLENSTPEVSPPGAAQSSSSSRNYWRNESESSLGSFSSDKFHLGTTATTTITTKPVLSASTESMTQKHLVSAKRSLAPSPPTETSAIQQFSSLTLETNPIECNANAKFICRKDYSEAAICKAVVAQGALEETSAKVKAIPMTIRTAQTGGKYSSVRIEVEATRENHAKVAAIKSVSAKEHQKTSGSFKPMCELIDEDLQRRRQSRSPCSLQSSISPASSSKSSDFGADNRSLDRMSFGSGGHLYGNDYKVVALNAKPEPGKLTEFVPEVERNKPSEREEYIVSSYGSANGATRSPPLDAAVVRNWELSDEELPNSKSPVNNNNTEKHVTTTAKIVEHVDTTKYDYPHLDRKFIRSQGYPTPFNANSKNYVKADSKFQILPKTEERVRPKIVKKDLSHQQQHQQPQQQTQPQPYGGSDTRRVHNDSRHPSGAPLPRIDLFSEEPKPLQEKSQSMLTVSGKLRCAHCTCELGRGSAMIIEALGLFYHINCFRCHVCDKMLGTGSQTTDVRVRDGKLHCEKCYSNEDIGVRLSEI